MIRLSAAELLFTMLFAVALAVFTAAFAAVEVVHIGSTSPSVKH